MDGLVPGFCFYDDPELPKGADADKWSGLLRRAHQQLWSKPLPAGEDLVLRSDLTVSSPGQVQDLRLSSDTIASSHSAYRRCGIDVFWKALSVEERRRYDRGFYTIGGFTVFPRRPASLNQRRGTSHQINDRFDLTLECIRLYYEGVTEVALNPLGDVLLVDAGFFDLFGLGPAGFASYVDFFHLGSLVENGRVRWFDERDCLDWNFSKVPLPRSLDAYIAYLKNVLCFVDSRNAEIAVAAALNG